MAYNTRKMLEDSNGDLIPQYFNQQADVYEHLRGAQGVNFVGNHVLTDSGIWVPQRGTEDGAAHTQLTGSYAEEQFKLLSETTITNRSINHIRVGSTVEVNPDTMTPVDISGFRKRSLLIFNNFNVSLTNMEIIITDKAVRGRENYNKIHTFPIPDIPAGASLYVYDSETYPKLNLGGAGIFLFVNRTGNLPTEDGSMTFSVYGYER